MIIKIKDNTFEPMKNIGTVEFDDVKISIDTNTELGKAANTILNCSSYENLKNNLITIEELFDVNIYTEFSAGEYDCNNVDGFTTLDYYYEKNGSLIRFEIWFENDTIHTLFKGVESEFHIHGLEAMLSETAFNSRIEIIASLTYTRIVSETGLVANFEDWKEKLCVNQFISETAGEY